MKHYILISLLFLFPQIVNGVHFNNDNPTEKILLLEHRTKDKTKEVRLKTKLKIRTNKGEKIKGILTDLRQDALLIDGSVIPLEDIEQIKPRTKRSGLFWLAWSLVIAAILGVIIYAGILFTIIFSTGIFLIAIASQSNPFEEAIRTLAITAIVGVLGFLGLTTYTLATKPRWYNMKTWRLRSIKS
ncbi:MAG: hypothetical protein AB8G11_02275 [Saprospiraceae bacterium]